jgi:hypothetical protein
MAKKKYKLPDFGADLERLIAERDAAEAEGARLRTEWYEKYMPEVEELIRYGEERRHGWAVGRTGLFSPRTPEEEAEAKALMGHVVTREEQMLDMFYGMADEVKRDRELGYEISRLDRKIKKTWEGARLFGTPGVINLKDRPRPERSEYVYIGRGLLAGNERFERSKWANPYTVKRYGRAEALARYEQEVRGGPLWDQLPELEGKTLACWCKPEPCHGDVLLRLIEERKRSIRRSA